jgi:hypothetical protein
MWGSLKGLGIRDFFHNNFNLSVWYLLHSLRPAKGSAPF